MAGLFGNNTRYCLLELAIESLIQMNCFVEKREINVGVLFASALFETPFTGETKTIKKTILCLQ